MKNLQHKYYESYNNNSHLVPGLDISWLKKLREEAISQFKKDGFPDKSVEEWNTHSYKNLTDNFKKGRTGNETLKTAIKESKEVGLRPQIYTHPLGLYGHSAGTTFGMWDSQEGVNGSGDHPLYENTVYAIELNAKVYIDEWQKDIRIMLEEAGYFGTKGFRYVNGRQKDLILIL